MLSKLKLYGELADFCGGKTDHEAVINQPIDAIRYLRANYAGIDKHLASQNYQVYIGEHIIDEELLDFPSGGLDVKIVPVIAGAGNIGKIIAGVALIGFAIFTGGMGFSILGEGIMSGAGLTIGSSFSVSALAGKIGLL